MSDNNNNQLDILIKVIADLSGAKLTETQLANVKTQLLETGVAASATSKSTADLGEKMNEGAKHAEHSHISHRALHQILHLIGKEAGPEAAAALAGVASVAAGGGIMIGIMAVKELLDAFHEMKKEAEEAAATLRESFIVTVEGASLAFDAVSKLREENTKYFRELDQAALKAQSQSVFKFELQSIKDLTEQTKVLVDEMGKAGLLSKDQVAENSAAAESAGTAREVAAKRERAGQLGTNAAALRPLLEALMGRNLGDTAVDTARKHTLEDELGKLREAFGSGREYKGDFGKLSSKDDQSPGARAGDFEFFTKRLERELREIEERGQAREKQKELEKKLQDVEEERIRLIDEANAEEGRQRGKDETERRKSLFRNFATAKDDIEDVEKHGGIVDDGQRQRELLASQALLREINAEYHQAQLDHNAALMEMLRKQIAELRKVNADIIHQLGESGT